MFKNAQMIMIVSIVVFMLSILSYITYVFYDRAEVKRTVIKQEGTIQTKTVEVKLTGIAENAKGQIQQVDKEEINEADTSFGVHHYTF